MPSVFQLENLTRRYRSNSNTARETERENKEYVCLVQDMVHSRAHVYVVMCTGVPCKLGNVWTS